MFGSLRRNIQTVQDGITAGFQKLSVTDRNVTTPTTESKVTISQFAIESELLNMYQIQWATMHHISEQNAAEAEKVDIAIDSLVNECESQHSQLSEIHSLLVHLPNIMAQLHSMLTTIGSMRGVIEEVEGGLLDLEDLEEELQLQEKTLDMRMTLALERERQTHRLSSLRAELISSLEVKRESDLSGKETERTFTKHNRQDHSRPVSKCIQKTNVPSSLKMTATEVSKTAQTGKQSGDIKSKHL